MTGADLARAEYLAALRIAVRRPSPAADRQRLKALARLAIAAADARGRP